ncbi:methylenetetrahydrofolate reductase [NAD(P)H] [Megalodesulfovibrio paquesii]
MQSEHEPHTPLAVHVAAGVLWRAGQFLAVRRPEGKPLAGFWEFPGGKLEPGETPGAALARELCEELGVEVLSAVPFHVTTHQYPHAHVTLYFFHVDDWRGAPHPHEGQTLQWCDARDAATLPFLPADEGVLALIRADQQRLRPTPQRRPECRHSQGASMRIIDLMAKGQFVSLEFFPPKEQEKWPEFYGEVEQLKSLRPLFVSVTYGAGGSTRDRTLELVAALRGQHGLTPMAHLTCVGAEEAAMAEYLDALAAAGVRNILALRGDPPKGESRFIPSDARFRHASDLVAFIKARHPEMCVGVAGYPEKHPEAASMEADLDALKIKVDAGADFIVTQLFFDNASYFSYVELVRARGIALPVLPGILPVLSMASVQRMAAMCGAGISPAYQAELEAAEAMDLAAKERGEAATAVPDTGIAHAREQVLDLLRHGAPGVHLYTLNKAAACLRIVKDKDVCPLTGSC